MKARQLKFSLWATMLAIFLAGFSQPALAMSSDEEQAGSGLPDRDESDPLYWAEMRGIHTVQQRSFLKEGRFALSLYAGMIPNNIFEQYFPLGLRANYYILENIGVELSTSYAFRRNTDLFDIVQDEDGIGGSNVLIGDTQVSHTTFGVQWSPAYGKLAFYDSGLLYFDMYIFGGAGVAVTQTQSEINAPLDTTAKPEGVLGAGLALYMGNHAGVRVDFRQFVFAKVEGVGGAATPSEVSLGFSWFF